MRKLCLLLLAALPLFAAPPVVSNISFLYNSHSSVSVVFDISATGNDFRVRYIPVAQGSCDQGNAAATVETFGLSNLSAQSRTGLQLPISGLAANTKYEFCPEVSNDSGSTWSTTGGSNPVGADFTTLPLPAIHPALPIHPATFDTSYPDTAQGTCWSTGQPGYCTVTVTVSGNSCTDLSADMNSAMAHQNTSGTIINIPAGSVCEYFGNTIYSGDSRSWSQVSADAISYNPSNVSSNTINLSNDGGLTEGEGAVFSSGEVISGVYLPGIPSGLVWGDVYFVHVVDVDHFQLYRNWEQETGSETSGSNSVVLDRLAGWASSPGISVGEEIVGSGIPSGTTISSIDYNAKTLTLSQAATATASGVTLTFGGPLQDIGPCTSFCTSNGGIAHFVPWPRQILYWIIVRTSTPDSQFAPEGTRVNPSWGPKMATIEGPAGTNLRAMIMYPYSTHIRFVGIKWTWPSTTEVASDPAPDYALMGTGSGAADIIFDRDWFHGPEGRDDRTYELMGWQGMDTAIINSYFDGLEYWHAAYSWPGISGDASTASSQTPSGTAGSTSFTVPQTTVYYGAANPATLPNTLTVSWTGAPDSSIATPEIAVYFDMQDNLQIVAPQGLSVTASAGTVSYTTTSGSQNHAPAYGYCDEGDPMIPVDTQGHEAAAPLGCVRVNASGQILSGGISQGTIYRGIDTEGCQCITAGVGPGPYDFSNNYMSATGIPLHFDNSGGLQWRGDYLIQRNTFHVPMTELNDSKNAYAQHAGIPSDGYEYSQRQMVEFKGVQRAWIDGNIFSGGITDIDQGAPFIFPTYGGDSYGSRDVDITNNTVEHYADGGMLPGVILDGSSPAQPLTWTRFRLYNNLEWDINGFIYADNSELVYGVGGAGQGSLCSSCGGPAEDVTINHNTFYDFTGVNDELISSGSEPVEGFRVTNNIFSYSYGAGGEDLFMKASANVNSAACGSNTGYNESAANCVFIAGIGNPDLIFKGNLIIPGWTNNAWPETSTESQTPISKIQSDWPDYYAQNTVLADNGVLADYNAVGWQNHTITHSWDAEGNWTGSTPNFRLLSQRFNYGQTSDGLQEGANITQLEAAQGKVTLVGANRITGSTATINYVAPDSASCSVDYSSTDSTLIDSFTRVRDAGGATVRNVTLTALSPHTVYHYRVDCAVRQPTGQFVTN